MTFKPKRGKFTKLTRHVVPQAADFGPCPNKYRPFDVDEDEIIRWLGKRAVKCPGRLRLIANAESCICDACFMMVWSSLLYARAHP
jgi:hypothetical protein